MVNAEIQIIKLPCNINFMGNDVDSNGVLWAGDKNFCIWKSLDKGATFQFVYTLPHEAPKYPDAFSGIVWNVFVDSRNYLFVSCGGANNSLYRSANGGVTFTAVLNANDSSNRSFYIALTEDAQGNLYAATYTGGSASALLLKSGDAGATWTKIGNFSIFHFHNIKYNPANGYLYAVTGERPVSGNYSDSEKVFRSKDGGETWTLVVDRNDALGTVYLAVAFVGNNVYLGQDYPNRLCKIHMFTDDGANKTYTPTVVYTPPADGCMPFISGIYFDNALVFGNCGEAQNGTSRVVVSVDGLNWNIVGSVGTSIADIRWNAFTIHPKDTIYTTFKTGNSIQVMNVQPTPTPAPSASPAPTAEPTDQPTITPPEASTSTSSSATQTINSPNSAPQATPKPAVKSPAKTPTPNQTAEPTPMPLNPTPLQSVSPTSLQNNAATVGGYWEFAVIAMAVMGGITFSTIVLKKRRK
jgi:hypothetical protein